jgi:glucokinase
MILAGDVGGTKTALGLFEPAGDGLAMLRTATFVSAEHTSLDDILAAFLGEGAPSSSLGVACLGVAGPVIEGKCHVTNLGWQLDEAMLARAIGVRRVKLLNDLEATAYGMLHLSPDELVVLNLGAQPRHAGNVAVIAAGTGLGEAMLYWDGNTYHPMASEGGHVGFAPNTDQEIDLLRFLRRELAGHVSYERVISGPGLHNIYRFLRQGEHRPEPVWLAEHLTAGDPSAAIAEAGLAGSDPVCVAALDLFSSIYGAEAGNLALKCLAMGGVFVAGGIAPKLLAVLQNGSFMRGFTNQGRFADVMQSIPVSVALNPRAALLGAAHFARRL